jgi:hypothetical protein
MNQDKGPTLREKRAPGLAHQPLCPPPTRKASDEKSCALGSADKRFRSRVD